ncbi:DUF6493 family protein [Thermomonospora cellulosilytica]|uniref:Secreted protein n=1 Tax=Thermomonospora cellulosilytica TaxID=1411118 RepID=A0A7W3MZD6_9ACTN|nr:DUF6493 family protein [Thermomonospora cellulosilytica]MBA9004691.1 hypothetical protein [Thermomonospora cellulosilytica]
MEYWEKLSHAVKTGTWDQVAQVVRKMDGGERHAAARRLPKLLKEMRDENEFRWLDQQRSLALLVAGAGTVGGAAGAATWVCRADLRTWVHDDEAARIARTIAELSADRGPEWRADFVRRVVERMERRTDAQAPLWHIVDRLARDAGEEPPDGNAYVLGWLEQGPDPKRLGNDPFLDVLVPRLFEVDGVGERLQWECSAHPRVTTWRSTLLRLTAEGRIERETLLDGCLRRLLRGGRDNALRWFVHLHDLLEPTPAEAEPRLRDHLRLLPTAPGPVAEMAMRQVRRIDENGRLDEASFAEAVDALLFRPEKKLVRAALVWLNTTARTHDRVDATLRAVTALFTHDDLDLRERAVKAAVRHAARASGEARRAVRDAATELPADLRALVAGACGPVEAPAAEPPPVSGPPPFVPAPRPVPIGSPAELAEELSACLRHRDPALPVVERLMAALVEHVHRDADTTREVLTRLVPERLPWVRPHHPIRFSDDPLDWLATGLQMALYPSHRPADPTVAARYSLREGRAPSGPSPLRRFAIWRMLVAAHSVGLAPTLLATPTEASGHIDPGTLVARMELLEEAGAEPAEPDLAQALLRLPRDTGADVITRAERLVSPAGKALAERLAAGAYADPVVTCRGHVLDDRFNQYRPDPRFFFLARVRPQEETGHPLTDWMLRLPAAGDDWEHVPPVSFGNGDIAWWPSLLPSHREVAAAHMQFHLQEWTDESSAGQGAALLGLAEAHGPTGPATAAALAYGLGCADRAERSGAVDALLAFSGQGALPAADLGVVIGAAGAADRLKLNRVVQALTDAVHAGAYTDVWTVIHAALPALLPEPGERAPVGLPDLIALGTQTAEITGLRTPLPELASVAGRGGSSRLVREAARLHRHLTGEGR